MLCDGLTKFNGNGVLEKVMRSGEWSLTDMVEAAELRRVAAERKIKYKQKRREAKVALHDETAPVSRLEPDVATAS